MFLLNLHGLGGTSTSSSPTIGQDEDSFDATPGEHSAPATPADPAPGLEYFAGINPDAQLSTRSLPSRNISFNNKVVFHDAWSPTEYDRRGDVATCNRLTPMLAQQIKEELNSFKMVSKPRHHPISILTQIRRWKFTKTRSLTRISSNDTTKEPSQHFQAFAGVCSSLFYFLYHEYLQPKARTQPKRDDSTIHECFIVTLLDFVNSTALF